MRKLSTHEEQNLALLTAKSVEVSLLEPTETGLKKSILDATAPVRRHLYDNHIHDYDEQGQGQEHKAMIQSYLATENILIPSTASLYRPETKKGDPRIWFKGLPGFSMANEILALIVNDRNIFVINLTQVDLREVLENKKSGPIWDLVNEIYLRSSSISNELLLKLKAIAKSGFVKSIVEAKADTAIGRTLETMLGIQINSSKEPDYKGIELKSYRSTKKGRENRKNLFAQVPNWPISKFKSSKEILDNFGYQRGQDFKLYCTVSTKVRNSQGLQFELEKNEDRLFENSDRSSIGNFATWAMDDLRKRLLEKHSETFWISADCELIDNVEHFHFKKVLHTKKPIVTQFDILLEQGQITMDHLIKRSGSGKVAEKGPLFKIDSNALELLFPPPSTYNLLEA